MTELSGTNHLPTVLVAGATGNQGGAVVDALARDNPGWRVRALTRDPNSRKAQALAARGVDVFAGDMADADSLRRALTNVDGVFSVQNSMTAGLDKEVLQGVTLADAAHAAGVRHFVYSSVGGADRDSGVPHFETKWRIEQHIQDLGLPATVLRPASFMEGFGAPGIPRILGLGIFERAIGAETTMQMIAVRDIGIFARIAFDNPQRFIGSALELAGDELTFGQILDAIRKVSGKKFVPRLPFPAALTRRMGDPGKMIRWIAEAGYQADISALRRVYPQLLRFEDWLQQHRR